ARALTWFVDLGPSDLPSGRHEYSNILTAKFQPVLTSKDSPTSLREVSTRFGYGVKYNFMMDSFIEANLSSSLSFSAAYYGKRALSKIVVGDYNIRLGQGLVVWSGFSLSALNSPDNVSKNPTGVNAYRSFSGEGTWRGVAAEFLFGKWTSTIAFSHPGRMVLCTSRLGRISQLGFTSSISYQADIKDNFPKRLWADKWLFLSNGRLSGIDAHVGVDARVCIKGVDLFGEYALDLRNLSSALLGGVRGKIAGCLTLCAVGRYYSPFYDSSLSGALSSGTDCTDEGGFSLAASLCRGGHQAQVYSDCAWRPAAGGRVYRAGARYTCHPLPPLELSLRLDYRDRDYSDGKRESLRLDAKWQRLHWEISGRFDTVHCVDWSFAGMVSGAFKSKYINAYLSQEIFRVDNWNDRIYVYQRDAPGNFTVPACYGRGLRTSLYLSSKPVRWLKLYLRCSTTRYPWSQAPGVKSDRLASLTLRLQTVFDLYLTKSISSGS
ncbi:MAG: hypothetical protein MJY67_08530, partial [Bacteroidales bacterium]|nr:hypothetical protein [Bacteroidales bacterium]